MRVGWSIVVLSGSLTLGTVAQAQQPPVAETMLVLPCDRPVLPAAGGTIELRCRIANNQMVRILLLTPPALDATAREPATKKPNPFGSAVAQLSHMPNPFGGPAETLNPFANPVETMNPFTDRQPLLDPFEHLAPPPDILSDPYGIGQADAETNTD